MPLAFPEVLRNVNEIANRTSYKPDVLYELMAAYGRSSSAITQLRSGLLNKAETEGAVLQKDVVYFRSFPAGTKLEMEVAKLDEDPLTERYKPRYLIATDLEKLAAKDTRKGTTLTIKIADIDNNVDFFYGWTGNEVVDTKTEGVADRRAADKMNELYSEIEKENRSQFDKNPEFRHELNVFFTRLLFCFFAEDTDIFGKNQFSGAIKTFTQMDGSDLDWFFGELFKALDMEDKSGTTPPFNGFPYVNGSIFDTHKHSIAVPKFSAQARHLILECGSQNWGEINPDIFGVMFQGIVDETRRDESGMDYTSVPNILKVIEPLFMDALHELFDKHYDNEKKLWALLARIQKIKIFDPACGSGNFLIISYKELRKLQHGIIARIAELKPGGLLGKIPDSQLININNFYGIEIDDFAHELAVLSLFLAKHQMNKDFEKQFGKKLSIIPLIDLPTVVCDNATRLDWQQVCPNVPHVVTPTEQSRLFELEGDQIKLKLGSKTYDEVYLVGNPPYKGSSLQSRAQKLDMHFIFDSDPAFPNYKNLDYISIWFKKGADYIVATAAELAFVSTNSICQGEQVSMLWPYTLSKVEIGFCYASFKWSNSARDNSGVTVIILSLRNSSKKNKVIFDEGVAKVATNINAYLVDGPNVFVPRRVDSISGLSEIIRGSMPTDGGNLTMNEEEYQEIVGAYPASKKFIKKYTGSDEYINGKKRYCLWIEDEDIEDANLIPPLADRLNKVAEFRLSRDKTPTTVEYAKHPNRFRQKAYKPAPAIIIPTVSSERRPYIPIGYIDKDTVASNLANVIYDADLYVFGLVSSRMHMAWIRTVCGKMKTDFRYSPALGYNTFPVPPLAETKKMELKNSARSILLTRENHPEMTLAELYDPEKMPADLRAAHEQNDLLVDKFYRKTAFRTDEERLASLFDLYENMAREGEQLTV